MTENTLLNLEAEYEERDLFFSELHQRNKGLLSDALKDQHVVVVGLGSVGSYISEKLVRAGLGQISIIDFDTVETHNITRTTYFAEDIGKSKAASLEKHLKRINPWVSVNSFPCSLEDIEKEKLRFLVKSADIIVAAADNNSTLALLNRISWHYDTFMVTPGLYKKAEGGEVLFSVPKLTPCMQCAVKSRFKASENHTGIIRDTDYGTGNLAGELAIAPDIHHVSGAATKIILSLLSLAVGEDIAMQKFIKVALQKNMHFLMMGMSPDFPLIAPHIRDASGQYAYQSLWITTQSDESCLICGTDPEDFDPIDDIQTKNRNKKPTEEK